MRQRQPMPGLGAKEIARARVLLGLTIDEISEAIGVSSRTFGDWERGTRVPNRAKIGGLLRLLADHHINSNELSGTTGPASGVELAIADDPHLSPTQKGYFAGLYRELRSTHTGERP